MISSSQFNLYIGCTKIFHSRSAILSPHQTLLDQYTPTHTKLSSTQLNYDQGPTRPQLLNIQPQTSKQPKLGRRVRTTVVPMKKQNIGCLTQTNKDRPKTKNAPSVGIEPTTIGLKGQRSTI